jgi:hypothetical protein
VKWDGRVKKELESRDKKVSKVLRVRKGLKELRDLWV